MSYTIESGFLSYSFFFLIEFIGVTLVNKIIQVPGVHSIIHHVYIIWCSPLQVKSPSITIYPPFTLCDHQSERGVWRRYKRGVTSPQPPLSLWWSQYCCLCLWGVFVLNPFTFLTTTTSPLTAVNLLSFWVCFYFVILFCSLDSTYEWNHMVPVFLWLTYFIT